MAIEGPDEIDPAHLAVDASAQLLLRNPQSWQQAPDGDRVEIVPEAKWLTWAPVPLVENPDNCEHGYSVCAECADSWATDYYLRFYQAGTLVYQSPDYPVGPDD